MFSNARLDLAVRYADLLATQGVLRGLIGPREAPRLWERHVLNCAALAEAIPADASVCDLGSGAGLPGIVLALARPDLSVTLVEPLLRRTTFLDEAVADLGLSRVEVVRERAEALHGQRRFDVVTSRALAPLGRLLGWSMPLVDPHGVLLAMKGSSAAEEIERAGDDLRRLGCAAPEVLSLGTGTLAVPMSAVRVAWADPTRVSLPRAAKDRGSTPRKRGTGGANRRRGT